jgi:hypothetical protein
MVLLQKFLHLTTKETYNNTDPLNSLLEELSHNSEQGLKKGTFADSVMSGHEDDIWENILGDCEIRDDFLVFEVSRHKSTCCRLLFFILCNEQTGFSSKRRHIDNRSSIAHEMVLFLCVGWCARVLEYEQNSSYHNTVELSFSTFCDSNILRIN